MRAWQRGSRPGVEDPMAACTAIFDAPGPRVFLVHLHIVLRVTSRATEPFRMDPVEQPSETGLFIAKIDFRELHVPSNPFGKAHPPYKVHRNSRSKRDKNPEIFSGFVVRVGPSCNHPFAFTSRIAA